MKYLQKTTVDEIAEILDEMEIGEPLAFSTEDPEFLNKYNIEPCIYHVIIKSVLMFEKDYTISIGMIGGTTTVSKDINILTNNNVNDEESRINGIKEFLSEYYNKYMEKNEDNEIYLIINP